VSGRRGGPTDWQTGQACRAARTRVGVLIVLEVTRLSRRYNVATPKRAHMARRFGCSERTITRNVRALEDAGWLTVVRDPPRRLSDGTYTRARTNLYRLHTPRNPRSHRRDTPVTSKPLRGCNSTPPPALLPVDKPSEGPAPPAGRLPYGPGTRWPDRAAWIDGSK
jgi:hypothetical protein